MASNPQCPRCGYDQTGIAPPDWPTSAVRVHCSECGLAFTWRDLRLAAETRDLDFFELAAGPALRLVPRLGLRALNPIRFWNWVKIEFPIQPHRVAAGVILAVILLVSSLSGMLFLAKLLDGYWMSIRVGAFGGAAWWIRPPAVDMPFMLILGSKDWSVGRPALPLGWVIVAQVSTVVVPFSFLLLRTSLRHCRVRWVHLLRIASYAVIAIPAISGAFAIASAIFRLVITFRLRSVNMAAPTAPWVGRWHELHDWLHSYAWTAYAVSWLAWLCVWWWAALRYYLKMVNAALTAILMVFLSMLATTLVYMLVGGGFSLVITP